LTALPWGRPRGERLLLVLVAFAALLPVYRVNAQDQARLCLSQALVEANLANDPCFSNSFDRASYGGHLYSDKAPAMSVFELPLAEAVRLGTVPEPPDYNLRLWVVRVLSSGLAFLVCAFLVGRIAEGLAPGFGAVSLVAFALGTMMAPLAATNFGHVPAAALGFGAFLLAWRRRPLHAGILAGAALGVEYQTGLILVAVGVYVALQGRGALARYVAGVLPCATLLLLYNQFAFGAPWHLSYDYVSNVFTDEQKGGFFGVALPHAYSVVQIFAGSGGLLVVSPVLAAAAWGLVLLAREHRAEAVVCAAVTIAFLLVNCGYFLPYGGASPGPRFMVPALPFLAVGLGPAFASRPRLTALLTVLSVVPTTALMLVWTSNHWLRQTVWGELARVPVELGSSRFVHSLTRTALDWVGPNRVWGAGVVALCALGALTVALRTMPWRATRTDRPPVRRTVIVASVYLIAAADTCAVFAYPYGKNYLAGFGVELVPSISASKAIASTGDEVNFTVMTANPTSVYIDGVVVKIDLGPHMRLLASPGCTGTSRLRCVVGEIQPETSTPVTLSVRIAQIGPRERETIRVKVCEHGVASNHRAEFTVEGDLRSSY
jgi:hypothetical protein